MGGPFILRVCIRTKKYHAKQGKMVFFLKKTGKIQILSHFIPGVLTFHNHGAIIGAF